MDQGALAQWVSAGITLLAVFVALFKETVLAWHYKPKLELRINPEAPDCHKQFFSDGHTGYSLRFWVFNNGNRPAKDVQVYAASLKMKDQTGEMYTAVEKFLPMNFKWSSGEGNVVTTFASIISPAVGRHCDFGHIVSGIAERMHGHIDDMAFSLSFVFDLEIDTKMRNATIQAGSYDLELVLAASNVKPRRYSISFTYDGRWSNDAKTMFTKHLLIRPPKEL